MTTDSMAEHADTGIVTVASARSGAATVERLQHLILERGLMLFTCIDFSGDAERAGLALVAPLLPQNFFTAPLDNLSTSR